MIKNIEWNFPLSRTHTGIPLGNATTGLLIWGESSNLRITIGRADFWDHRGGMPWTEKQNYQDIRDALEKNDPQKIREIFACTTENTNGQPKRPTVMPVGRLDLLIPKNGILKKGKLDLKTGTVDISYSSGSEEKVISVYLSMTEQSFLVSLPEDGFSIEEVTSWKFKEQYFSEISIKAPTKILSRKIGGWIQELPADPALTVAYSFADKRKLWGITCRGENTVSLLEKAESALEHLGELGDEEFIKNVQKWWKIYWKKIPKISIPNKTLAFIYYYGLYKFACFTNPTGTPATLQGPWIEEYEIPPWSSDYHFNINVQMCYWPAYKANLLEHLMPIFDLVWSWKDKLRENAKYFVGIDDGFMLPHAVDDRCTCMGAFWTGTIDHACSAWIAQMMYSYFKYTNDLKFLKEKAFPFMKGVMRVFEVLLEKERETYVLQVSVSPEYRGAEMDAWGRNASFQLAAIHRLCEDLIEAAPIVGEKISPTWKDIKEKLPLATLGGNERKQRIILWEGTDLDESHRHHSHLAAIYPFDTIDIFSDKWIPIIAETLSHWIRQGMGLWSGWCMSWASMIHSRTKNGEMAELILEIWQKVFMNEGYGTLHDCYIPGFTLMGAVPFPYEKRHRELMQMDAAMGSVTAVQDILLHSQRGVQYVFPAVPKTWQEASFYKMPCEGAFLISAERKQGETHRVEIICQANTSVLKLANPWGKAKILLKSKNKTDVIEGGKIIELKLAKGKYILTKLIKVI